MYIVPSILEEEWIGLIPYIYLLTLAKCSTQAVKKCIKEYLVNPEGKEEVRTLLREAYADVFESEDFLSDENLEKAVKRVTALSYTDVSAGLTDEVLAEYQDTIERVLSNKNSAVFVPPLNGSTVEGLIDALKSAAKEENDAEVASAEKTLAKNLSKYKFMFKDDLHAKRKRTSVAGIMKDTYKYEIIQRGIMFLRQQKAEDRSPEAWRYL